MDCEKIERLDLFSQALSRVRPTFFASTHSSVGENTVIMLMHMEKRDLVSLSKLVEGAANRNRRSSPCYRADLKDR
jgi:hypothetical protein